MNTEIRSTQRSSLAVLTLLMFTFISLALVLEPASVQAQGTTLSCSTNVTTNGTNLLNAVNNANVTTGPNTITLSPSCTYTLNSALQITDTSGNLTINGSGSTISGGGTVRVFNVAENAELILNNTVLSNGSSSQQGGAIFNAGRVSITTSTITNSVSRSGGAIYNSGVLTLTTSTISNNRSNCCEGETLLGDGGGIYNAGNLTVSNSTFSNNQAGGRGGAFFGRSTGGTTLNTVTVSGNQASIDGGGIFNFAGTLTISSSTITANSATRNGGGLFNFNNGTNVGATNLGNTIVAANTSGSTAPDVGATAGTTINSQNYNLFGAVDTSVITGLTGQNIVGSSPLLATLADNGGPTRTHALQSGSPAVDKGNCSGPTDQRGSGFPRPNDYPSITNATGGNGCDIGAFELQNVGPVANDDTYETEFQTELVVPAPGMLENDTDGNGDTLTATVTIRPTNGELAFSPNGAFTYTPNTGFSGEDTFRYTASDGTLTSEPATVTITVKENPAPTANPDVYETTFETELTVNAENGVLANDTDPNGDALTAILVEPPSSGTLTLGMDGSFSYIPRTDFAGADVFTYRANDGTISSEPAIVTINVLSPNPSGLAVEGDLNTPPIRPDLVWLPPVNDAGVPLPVQWYNVVIQSATGTNFNEWFQQPTVCKDGPSAACRLTISREVLEAGLLDGDYTWRVRAWANDVFSSFSDDATFTVDAPPVVLPSGFSMEVSTGRPTVTYPADLGTTWLHIIITTPEFDILYDQWFSEEVNATCGETSCSIVTDATLVNGSYQVFLQAWGPDGYNNADADAYAGPRGITMTFTNAALVSPGGATVDAGTPTLTWPAANGAIWYQVWLGTDAPDFEQISMEWYTDLQLGCNGGGTCTLTLDDVTVSTGETYIWYVQSWGPGGFSQGGVADSGWAEAAPFTP